MLGHKTQYQVGRDRRYLVEPGLTKFSFDVVFLGEGKAAVRLHAHVAGLPGGLGACSKAFFP